MNNKSRIAIALTFVVGFSTLACSAADAHKGRINTRQTRQQTRVYNGIAEGSLTRREAGRVARGQARIAAMERRMRASGDGLTAAERVKLEQAQDHQSKVIYNQKHDEQTRADAD
ncbi:MAG TPA: hypothetical protein V6D17_21625 [Candidatus Obscuribacterales bacterium]